MRPICLLLAASLCLPAQWLDRKTANIPRLANGRVDMNAAAPMKDGKPSFTGIWLIANPSWLPDLAPKVTGGIPMQPWAAALVAERKDGGRGADEPDANCLPQGVPKIWATPVPFKFVQDADSLIVLYEAFGQYRQIFTDGRALPEITNPTWFGYSVGRWDGAEFVIESTGFNGRAWLDSAGHPITESAKITERVRRKDFGHLEMTITIDDPKAYTKPWTYVAQFNYQPDTEILEFVCLENERDLVHLKKQR